jgi:hypothetical protein
MEDHSLSFAVPQSSSGSGDGDEMDTAGEGPSAKLDTSDPMDRYKVLVPIVVFDVVGPLAD